MMRTMRRFSSLLLLLALPLVAQAKTVPPPPVHATLSASAWTAIPLPAEVLGVSAHNGLLWAYGKDEMIALSADGGSTWYIRHWRPHGEWIFPMAFADPDHAYAFGTGLHSWRSLNGGDFQPWRKTSFGVWSAAINSKEKMLLLGVSDVEAPQRLFAVKAAAHPRSAALLDAKHAAFLLNAHTIAATVDGGQNWQTLTLPAAQRLLSITAQKGQYVAYGEASLKGKQQAPFFKTSTDGQSWTTQIASSLPPLYSCTGTACQGTKGKGWIRFRGTASAAYFSQPTNVLYHRAWAYSNQSVCFLDVHLHCGLSLPQPMPGPASSVSAPAPTAARSKAPHLKPRGEVVKAAGCISCPPPPSEGLIDSIRVEYIVGPHGDVTKEILDFASFKQDAKAVLRTIATWRYHPTLLQNGRAIGIYKTATINYVARHDP